MTIDVSSPNRPDLNQSQLYTLIITGHLPSSAASSGGVGATAQNEAASLVAGVIASSLQTTLAKHLPRYQRSMANYARLLVEPDED